jgi:hypothetical protein
MRTFPIAGSMLLLLFTAPGAIASTTPPSIDWTSSYNGPGSELEAVHDAAVRDGSLHVVGGATVDIHGMGYVTVKYAPDGTVAWSRIYEGFPGGVNQDDVGKAVAVDAAGNVYVSGYSCEYSVTETGTVHAADAVTLKYGPSGDLLWEHRYRGQGGNVQPSAVVLDPRGFLYVTGASWINGGFDVFLLKYDLAGNLLWSRTHGKPGQAGDAAFAMALDGGGNIVLGGYTQPGDLDVYVLSFAPDGAFRWEWSEHGRANVEEVIDVVVDAAGNTYALAQYAPVDAYTSLLTVKLDPAGTRLWSEVHSGRSTGDYGAGIELAPGGGVYSAGAAWENGSQNAMTLLRYTADGTLLWVRSERGGYYSAECNDLAVDEDGAAYLTGHAFDVNEDMQFLTAKFDAEGNRAWSAVWAAPEGRTDIAYHVRVGADRRVFVVGDAWRDFSRYFDITSVVYRQDGLVAVEPPEAGGTAAFFGPNPAFAGGMITLRARDAGPVEVFAVDGRRVLRLAENDAGAYRFAAPSAPGLYVVRAGGISRKLVVLAGR